VSAAILARPPREPPVRPRAPSRAAAEAPTTLSGAFATPPDPNGILPTPATEGLVRSQVASLLEYPEGVASTDVSTVRGQERYADVLARDGAYDIELAEIHRHLVPYHRRQIEDFVDAVRTGRDPAVTGREAVRSLEIVQAVYESSRTGAPVTLTRSA